MLSLINKLNAGIGRSAAWLALFMVLLEFLVVLLRYAFEWGSIALQEGVVYMHASLFMLTAAWALQQDAHVRVDIFYRDMSEKNRARVNLFGALFLLLPTSLFLLYICWDYVSLSWRLREGSKETGGLDAVFLLKSLMPIAASMLALQAVSQAATAALQLRGNQHA